MTEDRPHRTDMTDRPTTPTPNHRRTGGFTLTELLVVISIIVLILAVAVPLFNVFRTGRSVEGAENIVSAMLQRTRTRAMSIGERRGLFTYEDKSTGNTSMVIVRVFDGPRPTTIPPSLPVTTYIEVDPLADEPQPLPKGVGAAFVVGQTTPGTPTRYAKTGLIVFDAYGRIEPLDQYSVSGTYSPVLIDQYLNVKYTSGALPTDASAQYGIMLYEKDGLAALPPDPAANDLKYADSQIEWLDQNGLSLIVNRFNGTIFRGE